MRRGSSHTQADREVCESEEAGLAAGLLAVEIFAGAGGGYAAAGGAVGHGLRRRIALTRPGLSSSSGVCGHAPQPGLE